MAFFVFFITLITAVRVMANPACPVCTIAIGASLSVARHLGVDDCVVGVWSGAMLAVIGYWVIRWFDKKDWHFPLRNPVLMALSVASVGFVYLGDLHYDPSIIGVLYIDSFLFATLVGAGVFIGAINFYDWMKAHNGGHAHFPFEKVVVPVLSVLMVSLIFHFYQICNCHSAGMIN